MENQRERWSDTDAIELDQGDLESLDMDSEPLEGTVFKMRESSAHVGPKFMFEGPVIIAGNTERSGKKVEIEKGLFSMVDDLQQIKYHASQPRNVETAAVRPADPDSSNENVSTRRKIIEFTSTRCPTLKQQLNKKYAKIALIIAITAVVLILLIVTLALGNSDTSETDYTDKLSIHLKSSCNLTLVPRRKWEAAPSNCSPLLKKVYKYHLVKKVTINDTETAKCRVENRCTEKVKDLQKNHQTLGYCDIFYNFLMGAKHFVYEGEGMSHQENFQENFSAKDLVLKIGLIGWFPEGIPADLEAAAQCFIAVAQAQGFLDRKFIIRIG